MALPVNAPATMAMRQGRWRRRINCKERRAIPKRGRKAQERERTRGVIIILFRVYIGATVIRIPKRMANYPRDSRAITERRDRKAGFLNFPARTLMANGTTPAFAFVRRNVYTHCGREGVL